MSAYPISSSRQALALSAGEIVARILGFAGMVVIARAFGADVLGIIALGSTLLTVFSAIIVFGQDTYGIRRVASEPDNVRLITSEVISTKLMLSIPVVFLYVAFVAMLFGSTGIHDTVLYLFGLPLIFSVFSLDFLFIGQERNHLIGARMLVQATCYFLCLGAISLLSGTVVLIPVSLAGAVLAGTIFSHSRGRPDLHLRIAGILQRSRQALKASTILGISQISVILYLQLNVLVVGAIVAAEQLGIYAAGQRVTAALAFVPGILLQVHMARIGSASSAGERRRCIGTLLQSMSFIGGLLCGNLFILAPVVLPAVFGLAYSGGIVPLRILSVALWVVFFNMSFANPLLLWNEERKYLTIVVSAGLLNLAASVVLSHRWGITGAAIATLITETYVLAMSVRAYMRVVGRQSPVQWKVLLAPVLFAVALASGSMAPPAWSSGVAASLFTAAMFLSIFVWRLPIPGLRIPDASHE
ncbi:MAG: oligosaccharide flippase family protein [Bacteroidia bacterium]|nr:oligosaccharide flippase family protein [Bacteroidia bacterium]